MSKSKKYFDACEYNCFVEWFNARTKERGFFDRELINSCLPVFDKKDHKKEFWLGIVNEPKQLVLFT